MLNDPFVGRDDVMRILSAALDDAIAGGGSLVLLAGEPGMGKTVTAEQFVAHAHGRGATVLWGRCYEDEGAPAFWPWAEILRAAFRGRTPEQMREALVGAAEIAQLVPSLREDLPDIPAAIASDSAEGRFRLFDAVRVCLGRLSHEAPLLIVIDDLHGADKSSLRLLELLNRALRQMRMLILATYRDADVRHERGLQPTLVELARETRTQRIDLGGLTQDEVRQYIEAHAPVPVSDALITLVYTRTEGNPMFVGEFVRLLAAEGHLSRSVVPDSIAMPQSVRTIIERRFGSLSPACRRGLELAAVMGREFEPHLLASIAAASPPETIDVDAMLAEAEANGIISASPQGTGRCRFTHALLRETLYDSLRIAERPRLHRCVAEAIERQARIDGHLTVLAHHYAEAARTVTGVEESEPVLFDKVVAYARRAADRAMTLRAYEEAVRLYQLALTWSERAHPVADTQTCELMVDLGIAQKAAGNTESCKATLLEAAAHAERLEQPEQLARAALHFGSSYLWGESALPDLTLLQLLERALSRLPPDDTSTRARLLARLAIALRFSDQHARRLAASDDALAMARRVDDRTAIAHALLAWHTASWAPDNLAERLAAATELVEIATQLNHLELEIQGHACRFDDLMEAGNRLAADSELHRCEQVAQQLGQPFYSWFVQLLRAMPLLLEGQFADAEQAMQAAVSMGEGVPGSSDLFGVQMFMLYTTQRRREGFELMSQVMGARAAELPAFPVLRIAVAYCAAHLGRQSAARVEFDLLAAGGFSNLPRDHMHLLMLHQLAEVCAFLEDKPRAQELVALLQPYETRAVTCLSGGGYLGPVAHYLGLLETTLGQWQVANRHFERAIEMNTRMRARPWLAHSQYEYARMLLARDDGAADPARARALFNDALTAARELGMHMLEERVLGVISQISTPARSPTPGSRLPTADLLFRCEGQYWTVAYDGQIVRIKDSKGLQYLAQLLARPGEEIPALDLAQQSGLSGQGAGEKRDVANGGLAALDAQAKQEYRQRWRELRQDLAEAEELNDLGRAGKLKAELDFLTQQLNAAVDLHGRDRKTGAAAERARLLVTKRIKSALKSLDTLHPPLAHHLRACVKTGYYCAYTPPPGAPMTWQT